MRQEAAPGERGLLTFQASLAQQCQCRCDMGTAVLTMLNIFGFVSDIHICCCLQEQCGPAAAALQLKMHSSAAAILRLLQCRGQGKTGIGLQSPDVCSQCWWVHSSTSLADAHGNTEPSTACVQSMLVCCLGIMQCAAGLTCRSQQLRMPCLLHNSINRRCYS
jgi:hypothetical protein